MPKHVIHKPSVTVNSVNLSGRVKKVTILTGKRPPVNVTAMNDGDEDFVPVNIKGHKMQFEFFQDYAAANVYATLKGILDSDSAVTVTVRPFTAIRSATNPDIEGSVLLDGEFPLIAADDVGAVNMAPINFLVTGALAHVTSAT